MTLNGTSRTVSATTRLIGAALAACLLLARPATSAAAPPASATHFYITGAGFGHGIGMSQYGAAGYALHGYTYQQILQHYFSSTTIGAVNPNRSVTVLLREGAASFRGATFVRGVRIRLNPRVNYGVLSNGTTISVISRGRTIVTVRPPLVVRAARGLLTLLGAGRYRGVFMFRPGGGGVLTINAVSLENYVRGVVAAEMPATWPAPALEAQAVAARSYAVTAGAVAADFDVYGDTRSQMYAGVAAETAATNAAVAATRGQVVEYNGQPVVTYYFASSGGYTESVQNVWAGVTPEAWLVGVPDPYDDSFNNPYAHWLDRFTVGVAAHRLRGLYQGTFEGVNVVQTGVSPRVVQAQVVGTGGFSTISGTRLQQLFGTLSTDMQFATLTEQGEQSPTEVQASTAPPPSTPPAATTTTTTTTTPTAPPTTTPSTTTTATTTTPTTTTPATTGGLGLANAANVSSSYYSVQGTVYPAQPGATVVAQLNQAGVWTSVSQAQVTASGSFVIPVATPGTYRVLLGSINGPNITVP